MVDLSLHRSRCGCASFPPERPSCTGDLEHTFLLPRIRLFLPYRIYLFAFGIELSVFFTALSYPSEDPRSLHPALLNAIYLATCWIVGGELDFLKEHFLAQTRYHLSKALETGDRLMHFLWANVILGNFFTFEGRLNEAYLTISSCLQFARACGMDVVHYRNKTPQAQTTLLPPPTNSADAIDRARFSSVIYLLDYILGIITGTSSAFSGDRGPLAGSSVGSENEKRAWRALYVDREVRWICSTSFGCTILTSAEHCVCCVPSCSSIDCPKRDGRSTSRPINSDAG